MSATMRWYNPTRRVEEEVPAPMSEAQAIEMLSGHPDSEQFIEVYRRLRSRHPVDCTGLDLHGRDVLHGAPEGTAPKLVEREPLPDPSLAAQE